METTQAIRGRISANKFDPEKPLSEQEIRDLVETATHAPSSYNIQHWRFVAVTKPEDKERLKAAAYGQPKVGDAAVTFIVLGDLKGYEKLPEIARRTQEAGIIDAGMAQYWVQSANGAYSANERHARDEAIRSGAMAAMVLMLAAEDRGLVSGPMIGFDPEAVKREFGISDRYVPVMLVTVGHGAPGNWPRKPRLSVDEVLSFDRGKEF